MSTNLCIHCGAKAEFLSKAGKPQCQKSAQSCPTVRAVTSTRLKAKHAEKQAEGKPWRTLTPEARALQGWNKGQTAETNASLRKMSVALTGRRKLSDDREIARRTYYDACTFNLLGCIDRVKGYELLKLHGMYSRISNPEGVVRDHRLSRAYGFKHDIDIAIMAHPANCEFIQHKANAKKSLTSSLTLDELLIEIDRWNHGR